MSIDPALEQPISRPNNAEVLALTKVQMDELQAVQLNRLLEKQLAGTLDDAQQLSLFTFYKSITSFGFANRRLWPKLCGAAFIHPYSKSMNRNVDAELLTGLDRADLLALSESQLAPSTQNRLNELLADNAEDTLTDVQTAELDQLLEQVDQLTLLKARARYTLYHLSDKHPPELP